MLQPTMNQKEAMRHLRRWINNGQVTRQPFGVAFKLETFQRPTLAIFLRVVEALDGWKVDEGAYTRRNDNRTIHMVEACIPTAVDHLTK